MTMGYEQLSLGSFIKEMKEVTDGAHPRKFCFVLGAGASRTSGIKSGEELVRIWDKDLRERNEEEYFRWRGELSITDENMSSFYSQYYEKRFSRCRADGYNYMEKIMESAKPSAGYVMLAHLLTQTPHNVVITTNFDHLTEDAVNYYAQSTPLVIGHESLSHYVSGYPVRPTIIKIHRDLLFDPKSRSEDLEKLPDSWKTALELIFANYHPVFIGYAGNDKSLMDFLVENGSKFAGDEWKFPYWMIYKTDGLVGKVKEFLEKSNGFFIRQNGFDEVMIQLGAAFDYTIPTKDDFLADALKRYGALKDAIDAFSDRSKTANIAGNATENATIFLEASKRTDEPQDDKSGVNQAIEKITSQSEIQRMYREAVNLYDEENYEKAKEILEQLVELEPDNARYRNSLGNVLRHLDRNEEALAAYYKATEFDPENVLYHYSTATMLETLKRFEEALTEYRKAVELEPEDEWYHYLTGSVLERMGRYEEALAEYRKSSELDPDDEMNQYKTAEMLKKIGQNEEALTEYRKALRMDDPDDYYCYRMAKDLLEMHQYEDARRAIEKAIMVNSDSANYYSTLSEVLRRLGLEEETAAAERMAAELIVRKKA